MKEEIYQRIFHSIDIKHKLIGELSRTNSNIKIISAFCKLDALKFINDLLKKKLVTKDLLVRFRLEDLMTFSTDIEIYQFCVDNNWNLFIDLDLHSKIYIFDDSRLILGSPNLTYQGLGLGSVCNIESIIYTSICEFELKQIYNLFNKATLLTPQLYSSMKAQFEQNKPSYGASKPKWNSQIYSVLEKPIIYVWTTEMLFSYSPFSIDDHDRSLLELGESYTTDLLSKKLISSKAYRWLKNILLEKKEIYFGELTQKLHDSLLDDPKPYRKDVKTLLQNLISWIQELGITEIIIDQPRHSQLIKWNG